MNNEDSTIRSLQELKTLFDSGAITQEEYESLKKRIIFGASEVKSAQAPPPPVSSLSPGAGNPIETKVIFPTAAPMSPEPPVIPPPLQDPEESYEEESEIGVKPVKKTDWLLILLAAVGALLLVGLIAYQFLNKPESERLTSKSGPDTEEVIPPDTVSTITTETAPPPITTNQPESVATVSPDTASLRQTSGNQQVAENQSEELPSAVLGQPTGMLTDKNQIISKAIEQLNAYYADMQASPFNAANHFASQVERYYTLTNTTPAAINENINSYHFPEFLNGQTNIQEGSVAVVGNTNSGYELTYIENGSAFRKSKNQKQETKAAVRVKFNSDFKITFLRQEQLLENKFSE